MVAGCFMEDDMTIWNYVGWGWIIWTLFNEGLAMMMTQYVRKPNVVTGLFSLALSALAVWAAMS